MRKAKKKLGFIFAWNLKKSIKKNHAEFQLKKLQKLFAVSYIFATNGLSNALLLGELLNLLIVGHGEPITLAFVFQFLIFGKLRRP